tara:strand:- start:736 stop:1056 length:321 start_codon:yes stop_codon:yes gene_type:complete
MPYKPTQAMRDAARVALEYNDSVSPSNRWGTPVGRRRARKIMDNGEFDKAEISQIFAFLSRFEEDYNKQRYSKKYGKAYYAYLGWGGPSGLTWAEDKLRRYEKAGE